MSDAIDPNALGEISVLARMLVDYEREVDDAEAKLKELKEHARRVREESLPGAMEQLGLKELRLDTGERIEIKQDVYASIPKDGQAQAFEWLEGNGFGGLIKTEVSVSFGRDERVAAKELAERLAGEGLVADVSSSVHVQTLKAFLREQIADARAVPMELFGARPVSVAKVTKK